MMDYMYRNWFTEPQQSMKNEPQQSDLEETDSHIGNIIQGAVTKKNKNHRNKK